MNTTSFELLQQSTLLHRQGQFEQAEAMYLKVLDIKNLDIVSKEQVLAALSHLYMQTNKISLAIKTLIKLIKEVPEKPQYVEQLSMLYEQNGQITQSIELYQSLLQHQPNNCIAHFNLALLLKKDKQFELAIEHYNQAIKHKIDRPEEVHCNISVIRSLQRKEDQARESLEVALEINNKYVPAMFNLASLCEEADEKKRALDLYHNILKTDPQHYDALIRLVNAQKINTPDDPLIRQLKKALRKLNLEINMQESLHYALGKAYDDCGQYDLAFDQYQKANQINSQRVQGYQAHEHQTFIDNLIATFTPNWYNTHSLANQASPIFICGMFRSGSTLSEQILAAHSQVTAGGEIEYFLELGKTSLSDFPLGMASFSRESLEVIADGYINYLNKTFPEAGVVTDKRPDNYVYVGLIKTLFPNAKIIYTCRNALDNCLSVYFQQLGNDMNYATKLEDIGHYYAQQQRVMAHWQSLFGDDVFEFNYDEFVSEPEYNTKNLLKFCNLPWEDGCLNFHQVKNIVKTASIWQVRKPLYKTSSGRWNNYKENLGGIIHEFLPE